MSVVHMRGWVKARFVSHKVQSVNLLQHIQASTFQRVFINAPSGIGFDLCELGTDSPR